MTHFGTGAQEGDSSPPQMGLSPLQTGSWRGVYGGYIIKDCCYFPAGSQHQSG